MNNLKSIVEQWVRTRSVRLSHKSKNELSNFHKEKFGKGINTSCSPCIMKALDRVAPLFSEPKKPEPTKPLDLENMNMKQLREYAKANGIKTARSLQQQIELIRMSF